MQTRRASQGKLVFRNFELLPIAPMMNISFFLQLRRFTKCFTRKSRLSSSAKHSVCNRLIVSSSHLYRLQRLYSTYLLLLLSCRNYTFRHNDHISISFTNPSKFLETHSSGQEVQRHTNGYTLRIGARCKFIEWTR